MLRLKAEPTFPTLAAEVNSRWRDADTFASWASNGLEEGGELATAISCIATRYSHTCCMLDDTRITDIHNITICILPGTHMSGYF